MEFYQFSQMRGLKTPESMFNGLIYENALNCLFGAPNVGKSMLALCVCEEIARQRPDEAVLFVDYEMAGCAWAARLGNHELPSNLLRGESAITGMNALKEIGTFAGDTCKGIGRISFICIDNLLTLNPLQETANEAFNLISGLKAIAKQKQVTFLLLSHTTKKDFSKPVTLNDLRGSSAIGALLDSIFALAESRQGDNLLYIKHLKNRFGQKATDIDEVTLWRRKTQADGLVGVFPEVDASGRLVTDYEGKHLMISQEQIDRQNRDNDIIQMHNEGKTYEEIGAKLNLSKGYISRVIKAAGGRK